MNFARTIKTAAFVIFGLGHVSVLFSQWNCSGSACTTTGNVGIGTTSPVVPLDVEVSSNFHFGAFVNTPGATSIGAFNDGFSAWRPLSINPGGPVWFSTYGVGIGTTNPQFEFEVHNSQWATMALTSDGLGSGGSGAILRFQHLGAGTNMKNADLSYGGGNFNFNRYNDDLSGSQTLMTIQNNGNVGIGTETPVEPLDVKIASNFHFGAFVNTPGATSIGAFNDGFSAWKPLSINPGGQVWFGGYGVGIGTTNPQYPLSVNGTIQAKEVIVNTGWADYVFDPSYQLKPLSEVASYIRENHHLPDMPTGAEVRDKGVSIGEMQTKMLAKIEELTLHLIEAEEQIADLKAMVGQARGGNQGK